MTSTARAARRGAAACAALGLMLAAAPALAGPADLFFERSVMTAADSRCGLFSAPVRAALMAGRNQARRVAVKAGSSEAQLVVVEQRARRAAADTPCDSPQLAIAVQRVRDGFEGYAKLPRMRFPGEIADWQGDRGGGANARWRLVQVSPSDGATRLGLAGRPGADRLMALASFPGGAPYAARLVLRDPARASRPYLDAQGLAAGATLPLERRLPPDAGLKTYAAEARSVARQDLAPEKMQTPWAFRFPAAAAGELARLDPREAVAVEFVFAGERDEVRRVYFEVGDFAAGSLFLSAGR